MILLGVPTAVISGFDPGPGSADFYVDRAYEFQSSDPGEWRTPGYPGVPAGQPGRPLYLNFVNGRIGADVYIHGYLQRLGARFRR